MTATAKLNPLYRLQFEKAQNCHVLLFPEGMIKLSDSAGEILVLVDGKTSDDEIIANLQEKYPDAAPHIASDVKEFLVHAEEKNWLIYDGEEQ